MDLETRYANLLRGGKDNSPLTTDGYKFSMAQAGYPLRQETFYLHYRKGGALFIPFDFKRVVEALRPRHPNTREQGFLLANGYGLTPAMEAALDGDLSIYAQPKGSWANPQEPVLTLSGPSFLVSWYEAMVIAFHYPMQVATAVRDGVRDFTVTCEDEKQIVLLVIEAVIASLSVTEPELARHIATAAFEVTVCEDSYRKGIQDRLFSLERAGRGRLLEQMFEVGTRSMSCMAQHRIVLDECQGVGLMRTANVKLAYDLYMVPVGTTGHEHQERHGADINGFRAVRDTRPEPPSYLFDTYDPVTSGIPAAVEVMLEDRTRRCSVRFDSGDQPEQLHRFVTAQREHGLNLFYLFMDGYDDCRVREMDLIADNLNIPLKDRHYGIGGYLVIDPDLSPYSRNTVAMVYKLCQTGCRNVRKYSGSKGKASIAGRPIVVIGADGTRFICQQGEGFIPPDGILLTAVDAPRPTQPSRLSPETNRINEECRKRDLPWEYN